MSALLAQAKSHAYNLGLPPLFGSSAQFSAKTPPIEIMCQAVSHLFATWIHLCVATGQCSASLFAMPGAGSRGPQHLAQPEAAMEE